MPRNNLAGGTLRLAALLEGLRERLPPGWTVDSRAGAGRIEITSGKGESVLLDVVMASELTPRGVDRLLMGRDPLRQPVLVYARFLSATTRTRLIDEGAAYADATGNWRMQLSEPGLFLMTNGAAKDPNPPKRPLLSLKGPAAGRVVRALCDFSPPYGIRELADRADIPLGSLSRVVSLLDEAALIEREPRGPIVGVEVEGLIERWVEDYTVIESNGSSTWLAPRGLPPVLGELRETNARVAVTGSFGAASVVSIAPARLLMVYASDVAAVARQLKLVAAEVGANVVLLEPFDDCVFERTWRDERLPVVRHSQTAADLLTSPGRGPEEGEQLLRWMEANQDEWRS